MKTIKIIFFLFFISLLCVAQNETNYKNVIATDLTPLIKTILNFDSYYYPSSNYYYDPYLMLYGRTIKNKNVIRAGFGLV